MPGKKSVSAQKPMMEGERAFAINLMEHLVVPTFVLDAQCRVIIWNRACERLTGVTASEVVGTSDHWRAFYGEPRPCLADLLVQGRADEMADLYPEHDSVAETDSGLYAENWCVMPQIGSRRYLAFDAGPIFDNTGKLIAVVETLRDMTTQKELQIALQKLASVDALTSVANRRHFDEILAKEWRRAARAEQPLALLMVDVDHFKQYNDAYGHPAGDACLQQVATAMTGQMHRASDLVARYGGEEFAVILPNATVDGAVVVAERIRSAVENLALPHHTQEGRVTVSVGAAGLNPSLEMAPKDLIAKADMALYLAKEAGRNCVASVGAEA
jgi:diguanylate cyclase (GGDEF)-like protein